MFAMPRQRVMVLIASVIMVALFSACQPPATDTSASDLMPKLGDRYNITNITQYQGQISNLIASGAALTGNLPLAGAVKVIEGFVGCYKTAGAFDAALYVLKSNPINSGFITIVNKSVLTNPAVLVGCFNQNRNQAAANGVEDLQPCTNLYDFTLNGKQYTVAYAASDQSVCDDFQRVLPPKS